jgi:hypothetical protein
MRDDPRDRPSRGRYGPTGAGATRGGARRARTTPRGTTFYVVNVVNVVNSATSLPTKGGFWEGKGGEKDDQRRFQRRFKTAFDRLSGIKIFFGGTMKIRITSMSMSMRGSGSGSGSESCACEHPTFNIQHSTSNIQHPTSNLELRTSNWRGVDPRRRCVLRDTVARAGRWTDGPTRFNPDKPG